MLAYMSVSFFYAYVYTLRLYSAKQTVSAMAKIAHNYKRKARGTQHNQSHRSLTKICVEYFQH